MSRVKGKLSRGGMSRSRVKSRGRGSNVEGRKIVLQ